VRIGSNRREVALALVVLLTATSCTTGDALAVEEPDYTIIERFDAFELRRYEAYVLAEMEVEADFERAGNEAFRPLVRYIGGDNEGAAEMAMTAPVEQRPGRRMDMTAPVVQTPALQESGGGGRFVVGFVLPADVTIETAPRPRDPRIQLRSVPPRTVAVRQYRGGWSEPRYRREEAALAEALEAEGMRAAGPPVWARYNSPFMIWFLRRNEIIVELAPPSR
jgi:hypothetical protein